jgi:tetratricopeptide (TPR) repeat protein
LRKLILYFLLIISLSDSYILFAQDLPSAKQSLRLHKYEEAKLIVDALILDSLLTQSPEVWYVRGLVYTTIAGDIRGTSTNTDTLVLQKAYESYYKCLIINQKPYLDSAKIGLNALHQITINSAGNYYKQAFQKIKTNGEITALTDTTTFALLRLAYQTADLANQIKPNDTLAYSIAAYSALYLEDYEAYNQVAEKWLSKINLPQERYKHYEGWLAVCRDKMQDPQLTLAILEKALKEFPNDSKLKVARLTLSVEANKEENIIELAKERIKNNPRDPQAYFNLGNVYQKFNKNAEAIVQYQKVIQLDPSNFQAMYYVGGIYYNQGVSKLQEISQITFTDYQKSGELLEEEANVPLKLALPYFEQLHALSPRSEEVLKPLYQIYKRLKMKDLAEKTKQKLILLNPTLAD